MKNVIISMLTLVLSSIALAVETPIELGWTSNSASVQAIVYEALQNLKAEDEASDYPQGYVQDADGAALAVRDNNGVELVCDGTTLGVAMVMDYRCVFSTADLKWTKNAVSVQAILFDALYALKESGSQDVQRGEFGELIVQDGNVRLSCDSRSFGMLAVQSYSCQLTTVVE